MDLRAPAASRTLSVAAFPFTAATCRGVSPLHVRLSTQAPCCSIRCTIRTLQPAAMCKGVICDSAALQFTVAPWWERRCGTQLQIDLDCKLDAKQCTHQCDFSSSSAPPPPLSPVCRHPPLPLQSRSPSSRSAAWWGGGRSRRGGGGRDLWMDR